MYSIIGHIWLSCEFTNDLLKHANVAELIDLLNAHI